LIDISLFEAFYIFFHFEGIVLILKLLNLIKKMLLSLLILNLSQHKTDVFMSPH